MRFKRQAIFALSVASLLAASIGSADFAMAEWAENGSWIPTPGVTCAEAQNAINNAAYSSPNGNYKEVRIIENCSANLVIPSGKRIALSLQTDYTDELGNLKQKYYRLSDDGGDTITVEEGATLFLTGSPMYDGLPDTVATISNSTSGKSVINNRGTVRVGANLTAENGAYLATNSGKLYTVGGVYTGGMFQDNGTGRTYIAMGVFNGVSDIRQYLVNGVRLDEGAGRVVSTLPDEKSPFADYPYILSERKLPVGYSFTLSNEYADLADAIEMKLGNSDESILRITGSNQEGWTFTVVGAGDTCAGQTALYFGGDIGCMTGYVAPSNTTDTTESLTKYLVNKFFDVIQKVIEDGKTISLDLEIDNKTNATNEEKTEVAKVTGEDKVVGYYDIELVLNGDGEKLTNVTDLEDEEMEVHLSADFLDDLEKVAEGYTRNYYIVRLHEGVAEKINARLEGKELVFKSGKFSTYAVAYTDTKISDTPIEDDSKSDLDDTDKGSNNSNTDTKTPDTPDTGVLAYITSDGARVTALGVLVAVIMSGLVASVVIIRKRQKNSK